jgi:hypothetical protein
MLLLCNRPARGSNAETILEHIDAIKNMPGFRVREVSMLRDIPSKLDLDRFDVVGIHYSLHISDPTDHFLSRASMDRIAAFKGAKCIWMHDEYRRVNETRAKLRHMGIDTIFTVIPEEQAKVVYPAQELPGVKIVTVLTGYVSEVLRSIESPALEARNTDIVYRARRPPFWLGRFAYEKIEIAESVKSHSAGTGLVTDISVEEWDRVYGKQWLDMLRASKAGLSVESGASIVDFTGEIEMAVNTAVSANPNATFEDVAPLLAMHDEDVTIKCVSPRIFEMAACKTLILAYPGYYSGLIKPWVHYIPIERDFTNFTKITDIIKSNMVLCNNIVETCYKDLIASDKYKYDIFSQLCVSSIGSKSFIAKPYSSLSFTLALLASTNYVVHKYLANSFQKFILTTSLRKYIIQFWSSLPEGIQNIIRPFARFVGR